MEMIQTEAAINANPEMILLEVTPGGLWDRHTFNWKMMDYFQLRLTINSLLFNYNEGEWVDILRPSESKYFSNNFEEFFYSESSFLKINRRIIKSLDIKWVFCT